MLANITDTSSTHKKETKSHVMKKRKSNNAAYAIFVKSSRKKQDSQALANYESIVSKESITGSYMVGFPWIGNILLDELELDLKYQMARNRFNLTMARLDKD